MFHFLEGYKVSFSVMINSSIGFFDLNRKPFVYLAEKQNKENFVKKKFVDSGIVKTCDELDLSALELLAVTGVFDLCPNGFESLGTHCFISHKEPVKKHLILLQKTLLYPISGEHQI
jgi:hypothetical protein